jgi:hypothetical protein
MFAMFPNHPSLLCTADKNLALFWTGIGASNFERTESGASVKFSPVDELLGGSTSPEWRAILAESVA